MPLVNAVVASRPLSGRAATLAKNVVMYSWAASSLPPSSFAAPYAASRFHFAEPEEAGLGVTMPTPSAMRSSQVSMPLGLPFWTTNTTTEFVQMPLVSLSFQSSATRPSSTRRVTSGSRERWTSSALAPATTARDWSPEAPYDSLKLTSLPASVSWKAEITPLFACSSTE